MRNNKPRFLISVLVCTLILGLCSSVFAANEAAGKKEKQKIIASQIYFNGTVVTVDENMSYAQAVAVKDGKIIAVGKLGDIMPLSGKNTEKINLQGKALLPGFYDAHGHFLMAGESYLTKVQLQSPPIGTIENMEQLLAALSERAETLNPGEWLLGSGYDDMELTEKRHPTVADLDKISTEIPIVITHFSAHNVVANSKALEMAGITADTPDPSGGTIGHFSDGTLNGQLWENAMYLVTKLVPPVSHQDQLEAIALASDIYASKGTTTANNGGWSPYQLFEEAADQDYLKIRTALWFDLQPAMEVHDLLGDDRSIPKYSGKNDLVVSGGIKMLQDGSPQLRTAYLTDPYYTTGDYAEDWVGYPWYSKEELTRKVVDAHEAGFDNIFIHGNGDAAIDDILDAYEEVRKDGYRESDKLRHVVIHSQFTREEQLDRMEELGVIPSFLILHTYYLGDRHWEVFFGPERSARMSPAQDAVDRNLPFTLHSDTPVFPHDPLMEMWAAVNRLSYTGREIFTEIYNEDDKYRSVDQRITPEDALRALTINGAYMNGEEDVTGSIEVGKRADFVILEKNPLDVDPMLIKDIKVMETIVGGETVYSNTGK
ncbi:amidohydrolase [Dehalobacterium formicoaceticum]|uniref:amidohydrolase n=1 Tax=Dehalobacterium formicoaceticum TaxID=51515 RepID=UPI0031F6E03B